MEKLIRKDKGWSRVTARSWGKGQTIGATIVLRHLTPRLSWDVAARATIVRFSTKVDRSYAEQGSARVEVWTADGWQVAHSLPGEVLAASHGGRPPATLEVFKVDHVEMARVACGVLMLPPIPEEHLLEEDPTLRADGRTA